MNPWRMLTGRGRALLIVGILASIGVIVAGQRDLGWVAALVALLPIGSLFTVLGPMRGVTVKRRITPPQVAVGDDLIVDLTVSSERWRPIGLLRFEEVVPKALGERPRFNLQTLSGRWQRQAGYTLRAARRGRHTIGPLLVRSVDPLGLAHLDRSFEGTDDVLVTPVVHELDAVPLGSTGFSSDASTHNSGLVGRDDVVVREYVRGDSIRRVHWRSSARHDKLMVRREEQAWDPRALILLDSRATAHVGEGEASSFEWAVSAVASIAVHLIDRGFEVNVADASGLLSGPDNLEAEMAKRWLLGVLAEAALAPTSTLHGALVGSDGASSTDLVIAVLGRTSASDLAQLLSARSTRTAGIAFLIDVDSFAGGRSMAGVASAEEALRAQRWSVVPVDVSTPIADAWDELRSVETAA